MELTVSTKPTDHALARIVAALHNRGACVEHLVWAIPAEAGGATATLRVRLEASRHAHLRAALARLVDVTEVNEVNGVAV